MTRLHLCFCGLAVTSLVTLAAPARAQSVVADSRRILWSQVGIPGGIPTRPTICATLNPGVTATQINSAIASCPAGQTVRLQPGTYNIDGIDFGAAKSNVTLRGAGANQTFLIFNANASVLTCNGWEPDVCIHSTDTNYKGAPTNLANWSSTSTIPCPADYSGTCYPKGLNSITLSSTTNLAVGKPMIIDQLNDDSSGSNFGDNGGIYVCATAICSDDSDGGPGEAARLGRDQLQVVTVTNISGNQVTFTPGLYMPNWRASASPQAWWADSPTSGIGIEDLSLDHSASNDHAGIVIFNCSGCWVKGIRSIKSNRSHVWIQYSRQVVVRDSYFYGTLNGSSQSYGIETYPASDTLIENNIFQQIASPEMLSGGCPGCVWGYNFSIFDDHPGQAASYMFQGAWIHAAGADAVLFEGEVSAGLYSDTFHGSHHFITMFRNRYRGYEVANSPSGHTNPVAINPMGRFYNVVGNVLGDVLRPHDNYQRSTTDTTGSQDRAIYSLGIGTTNCCLTGDDNVKTTLMRWGNYDTVTGTVRFDAGEVPSALTGFQAPYSNPVPSNQVLPPSMYLAAKPAWWPSSKPWPAIGPDVTGGNIPSVGGHAYTNPAQDCYLTIMLGPADGTGGVRPFNAAACYAPSTGVPSAPANLRIIR